MSNLRWNAKAARPTLDVWWFNNAGHLIDMSTATFSVNIGRSGGVALVSKSTGITGAVGSGDGEDDADVPNVVVAWAPLELDILPGEWDLELWATVVGLPRVLEDRITITKAMTPKP